MCTTGVFGVAAGDGHGGGQLPDAESGQQSGDSAQPAVAVGGIARVEFIGATDPADARVSDDVVEELRG